MSPEADVDIQKSILVMAWYSVSSLRLGFCFDMSCIDDLEPKPSLGSCREQLLIVYVGVSLSAPNDDAATQQNVVIQTLPFPGVAFLWMISYGRCRL